mgnify:CR=1 FL=1
MFRFWGLTLLAIMVMSTSAFALDKCPPKPMGKVNIVWGSDNIRYDFTKSQSQMDRMQTDTVNPYGRDVKTHVGGLMRGGISVQSNTQVAILTFPRTRQACLWVDKVDISIRIDPKIYIAREHRQGSCKHNAILEHEMKHVFVDREIVKKYIPIIHDFMEQAVTKVGLVGPKDSNDANDYQKKIVDYMQGQLKRINERMYEERKQRQRGVDTLEEYERVANMCR